MAMDNIASKFLLIVGEFMDCGRAGMGQSYRGVHGRCDAAMNTWFFDY
jgi:hypothetical protein